MVFVVVLGAGELRPLCLFGEADRIERVSLGVVGLSTALTLQDKGYDVTIVADQFPEDPRNIRYTSHWAVSLSSFARTL
jgi:hypothetical protein